MLKVLGSTWALLLGMMLFMLGNGMQGTLLGIRGEIEDFSTNQLAIVMSGYFVGFLFGSRLAPDMIRRVGHVRVFAALGSLISAVLILYAAVPHWAAWALMRVLIGFCFSGVYITAESWLNNAATNENRGQALSLYLIVQMFGIILAQLLLNVADPSGYVLFVIPSILVSLAFTPILLSISPAPAFESIRRMSFRELYDTSPLGCVGMFLLGGIFSAQFGMAAIWATQAGLNVRDLSIFIASIYVGGLVLQFPIGWLSDRMDRRGLIVSVSLAGALVLMVPIVTDPPFAVLLMVGAMMGGLSNPLYSLLLAYVNDYLDHSDMAAASAGLMFINGLGAISGPIITGWMMGYIGPSGFFLFMALLFGALFIYGMWRMMRNPGTPDNTGSYTTVMPTTSIYTVEAALEYNEDETS
ncbi:MFS transporter [Pararhodobacter oceanensis]|uniref:MFS transporter n=1 Tax=Pararhodobacter oceanensis TaxID=2172121 RepID=A0A2T8HXE3_9RHOB|nr:MFS transporter [Pararhodobacter oceanensis]PVH30099.1 MFS transporter [Pararhodobacter oceanensis]